MITSIKTKMKTTRRGFLRLGLLIGAGLIGSGSYTYLFDENIKHAPVIGGKILCDLHAHPSNKGPIEDIIRFLGSPGLVGLTVRYNREILTYGQAKDILKDSKDFYEITPGQLAKFRQGYFARTQEIIAGMHHILAIGWQGNYFPKYSNGTEAVNEIHAKNGIAVLNHAPVIPGWPWFRLAAEKEMPEIEKIAGLVDEIEAHNSYLIDLLPVIASMRKANLMAENLAIKNNKKGIASSDTHRKHEYAKTCGIYIDKDIIENQGMEGIKTAIKTGNFTRYGSQKGPYLSRAGWLSSASLEDMLDYVLTINHRS